MAPVTLDPSNPKHAHAAERLRDNVIVWLSSVRPDGRPHLVPVWFLWDGDTVLIFSMPDQKIRNLRQNPQVVLALDGTDGGEDIVEIEGEATLLASGELSPTLPDYATKYAAQLQEMGWTAEAMGSRYTEAIRIRPARFRVP
jgi:PPOX class probable F420-dependent enzyme